MSDNFTKCVKHLDLIKKLPVKSRKNALAKLACDSCYYKSIKEIAKNIVKKNIKPTNLKKIKIHWKNIAEISGVNKLKKRNKKTKKDLVIQSGGWIWSVLPIVISLLESIK
jgi:hypothetical protein